MMSPRIRSIFLQAAMYLAVYAIVLALINVGVINDYLFATLITICINIVLAVSLNLITGFTGQFSLGHAGFMALGAYGAGLTMNAIDGIPGFLVGLLVGALVSALVGFLIGLPTLRLRGDYLAIATLGMAEIIRILLVNSETTNGAAGLMVPRVLNWNWAFALTAITIIFISNLIKSRQGRDIIAVREDEIAAEAVGVNTTKTKVLAFTVGAFFAGIGGAMFASYFFIIKPDQFGFMRSVDILVIVVLGGLGSLSGSIIAAVLLAVVSAYLQDFPQVRMIIYSLVLIVIMLFRPQGLLGNRELSLKLFKRVGRFPKKAAAPTEPAAATKEVTP